MEFGVGISNDDSPKVIKYRFILVSGSKHA